MPSIVLCSICLMAALLLSVINIFTAPEILDNQQEKTNSTFTEILPGATGKEALTINESYPEAVVEGYKFDNGFVFKMSVSGYKDGLIIMCGIDLDGKITGVKHIQTNETYGMEAELNKAYVGDTAESLELILATGATKNSKSSKAYYDAMSAALNAYVVANGGTADNRTPEEKLKDNCNAALGTTDVSFTKWIGATLSLGCELYVSENNSGIVIAVADTFIGYGADGVQKENSANADEKAVADNAYSVYSSAEKIDLSSYGNVNADLIKEVWLLSDGNYVVKAEARGYGTEATGKYSGKSGKRIFIELSITGDGKIISCVTTEQNETSTADSAMGTVCGDPSYYEQYNGKTATDITDGFAQIAGSTMTSNGYRNAVRAAVDAITEITKGGN